MSGLGRSGDGDATVLLPGAAAPPAGQDRGRRILRLVGWIQLGGGALFLVLAAVFFLDTRGFLARAVETEAQVARLVEHRGDNGLLYTPVFVFSTPQGTAVEVLHTASANPPAWRPGQRLQLLYDPLDPKRASPASAMSVWLLVIVFGGVGFVMLVVGAVLNIVASRRVAPRPG
ncbi:DUF3592 domain-containing protein [Falsiroseomonas oryziterrae]|uniref:DUF3592 domain-containing protein n=1 Tax=Falsiroseomonas oryziterrae TaxID=2911368 RepID=UPI001F18D648|nr:DUF3592 domain-containing protein [Roseomonas sp. NPKOSM-4]